MLYDLWDLDLAPYYHQLDESGAFGYIPKLALTLLGAAISASYVERVNSAGKKVYPVIRKMLDLNVCEMLVILRMNREFFTCFEKQHPRLLLELTSKVDLSSQMSSYLLS